MKVYYGTKKEWRGVGILLFAVVIYIAWIENRPIPKVEFGYPESANTNSNEFFDKINIASIKSEHEASGICRYLNGAVHDFAGYQIENKGTYNKGIMEAIVPEVGFLEGWLTWKRRLYKKAPLHFSTKIKECVMYPTKGMWLTPTKYPKKVKGRIVMSCCWDK